MISFLRKRLVASLIAILLVTFVVFVLARLQGDPRVLYTDENLSQETYDALGRELGLDRPLYYQYWVFVSRMARGDLGVSIHQHRPVFDIVLERLPATLKLAGAAFLFFPGGRRSFRGSGRSSAARHGTSPVALLRCSAIPCRPSGSASCRSSSSR